MLRRYLWYVLFLLSGLTLLVVFRYRHSLTPYDDNIWRFVPNQSALVFEVDQPDITWRSITNEKAMSPSLVKLKEVAAIVESLGQWDSLFVSEPDLLSQWKKSPLLIAIWPDSVSDKGRSYLMISQLKKYVDMTWMQHYLADHLHALQTAMELDVDGIDAVQIVDGGSDDRLLIGYKSGNLLVSNSRLALEEAVRAGKSGEDHFTSSLSWKQLKQTAGAHVDARIYIQYEPLRELLLGSLNRERNPILNNTTPWAGWTEADIIIKDHEWLLSGYTQADAGTLLNMWEGQKPVEQQFYRLAPFNTNLFLFYGFSDYAEWFRKVVSEKEVVEFEKYYGIKADLLVKSMGQEAVLVSNAITPGGYEGGSWVMIEADDSDEFISVLKKMANQHGQYQASKAGNYILNRLDNGSFIRMLLGPVFPDYKTLWFAVIDGWFVFADSESSMRSLINFYETGKTLDLNDNFKAFSDNLAPASNITLFIKPGELHGRAADYLTGPMLKEMLMRETDVSHIQGAAFQTSTGSPLSYTNVYFNYDEAVREENLAIWKKTIDDVILFQPILVSNHKDENQNIIVFDASPAVYLISGDGDILWKQPLQGNPMGLIHEVDYYKNGKVQYLFNTSTHIYLLDINGKPVADYPKKLHLTTTGPMNVFDYSGRDNYRLFLAQSDKTISNLTIAGKEVEGWQVPHMPDLISDPVERLVINGKDYILITDMDGHLKIVDRRGSERIRVKTPFKRAANSNFYMNKTNSKGIIITTDESGKLVYISSGGKVRTTDFGDFSPQHFFLYNDFNGDGTMDFVYVDKNRLQVFDRFKKLLFEFTFDSDITIKPEFFTLGRREKVLGVVAAKEKTIYLFDSKGNTVISSGLVGETPFTVGSIENNRKINLISGAGNTLYNYRLN